MALISSAGPAQVKHILTNKVVSNEGALKPNRKNNMMERRAGFQQKRTQPLLKIILRLIVFTTSYCQILRGNSGSEEESQGGSMITWKWAVNSFIHGVRPAQTYVTCLTLHSGVMWPRGCRMFLLWRGSSAINAYRHVTEARSVLVLYAIKSLPTPGLTRSWR